MEKDIKHPVGREHELFPIIHRFCTEKTCYQGLEPDDQVSRYFKNTSQFLGEDMLKETPDPDDAYTIAANYMLIMANTAEAQKQKKKRISFVTEAYDAENAKTMVDRTCKMSARHEQATAAINRNKKFRERLTYFVIFCIVTGVVLLGISLVFGINSYSDKKLLEDYVENYKPERKNVFQQFGDWVSHDVFHSPRKESEFERQTAKLTASANSNQRIAQTLLVADAIIIILLVSVILAKRFSVRKYEGNISEWEDYQKLCSLFDEAEARALGGIG